MKEDDIEKLESVIRKIMIRGDAWITDGRRNVKWEDVNGFAQSVYRKYPNRPGIDCIEFWNGDESMGKLVGTTDQLFKALEVDNG